MTEVDEVKNRYSHEEKALMVRKKPTTSLLWTFMTLQNIYLSKMWRDFMCYLTDTLKFTQDKSK